MKKIFLNWCLKIIKENNKNISDEKLDEIRYGLEGVYLTITKAIFIFVVAYILGIFKEMIILLVTYNILRTTGFGLHAEKSWQCWISSSIMFLFLPFIAKTIIIPINIKIILCIIAIILIYLYAPADTKKHPLINVKKRKIWKIITTVNCIILSILSIIVKDSTISNLLVFGIYTEILVIIPISYKIFNLSYNNYLSYGLNS